MKYYDSHVVVEVKKMISDKKLYLSKLENKFAFQQVQKEIMLLEREVLPELLYHTNVIHSEISKYAVKALEAALRFKCNGLLVYFPIVDNYEDKPIIGVANPRSLMPFRTAGAIDVSVDNMDGYGVPVRPINLPLNELL